MDGILQGDEPFLRSEEYAILLLELVCGDPAGDDLLFIIRERGEKRPPLVKCSALSVQIDCAG